ncbi:hypothetical protein [Streptomyces carminius]|uniref:hypothetical protein n=1 Tax=Streptomyces carminius TaxID=2665496 RepID=UPI0011B5A356|nr:hypothetical protein [Streptomyces carminius]
MDPIVLRRKSWLIFSGLVILGSGVGMLAAVVNVTSVNGFQTGWQGVPVFFAFVGVVSRVANCKVILLGSKLIVVNPLRTTIVPMTIIRGASVSDDGTLQVQIGDDQNIPVFAFGGSLVDRFKDTSSEAAQRIDSWLRSDNPVSDGRAALQVRWTRCTSADLCLILCAVISGAGALWMALGSNN